MASLELSELQSVVNCRGWSPSVWSVQDLSSVSVALYGGCPRSAPTAMKPTILQVEALKRYKLTRSLQPVPSLLPSEAKVVFGMGYKTI